MAVPSPVRTRLTLEVLEDRVLMAGNLFVNTEVPGSNVYHFMQYAQDGTLLSSQVVPGGPGSDGPEARGLSVSPNGDVNIYDGTFSPALATLSSSTQTWSYQTLAGWSTVNNISYGEVAAYNNFVFASDMFTYNGGEKSGIVRFDSNGGAPVRFADGTDYIQVSLGIDGMLYGLEGGGTVHVFNPDTLAAVRTFSLTGGPDYDIRSIAVDASGQVFAATWGGYVVSYDANGKYLSQIQLIGQFGGGENVMNIALDTDGQIAVGGRSGDVFLTDESLSSYTTIQTNQWDAFVTFDHYIGTNQQLATPSFDSLAGPTITYGQPTVTLGGHIAAGSSIPTGSVSITVNGITQDAVINSDGTFSADFDTSTFGAAGSPYTITYSYAGDANNNPVSDSSQSLTILQAVTSLSNLSSPTIAAGTPTTALTGVVVSNSVLPVGQTVTVTATGSDGTVTTIGSGTIGSDGSFSIILDTSTLPADSYTLQYVYPGDDNFTGSNGTGTLTVTP